MRVNASAMQAFGEGIATTAFNIVRASEKPVTRLSSVYQEGFSNNVEHQTRLDSQAAPIDIAREMVTLIQTEAFHAANAVPIQAQDELLETIVGLVVDSKA